MRGCHHLPVVSLFLQTGGPGGFDLAGLLNNPGFMSMVNLDADHSQAVSGLCIGLFRMKCLGTWLGELPCLSSRFVFISCLGFSIAVRKLCLYFIKVSQMKSQCLNHRLLLAMCWMWKGCLFCITSLVLCVALLLIAIFVLLICFQVFLPSLCLLLNGTTSAYLPSHF